MLPGLAIFLSAFLLFQVQFILGKHLLPWFGGAPMVWSTCLVFFQSMLLAGYGYAHGLAHCRPRQQAVIHTALLILAGGWLTIAIARGDAPLLPGDALKPEAGVDPLWQLLTALLVSVAAPFIALAATSPLVQYWHARAGNPLARTFRLYALSNAGSLLGLVSYPFLVERWLALPQQAWLWAVLFALFAVACGAMAWRHARHQTVPAGAAPAVPVAPAEGSEPTRRAGAGVITLWVLLPCAGSLLLAATTNRVCQDVAVVPFLWMLPLALYLVTFIISFDRPQWYSRGLLLPAALVTLGVLHVADNATTISLGVQLLVYSLFLFLLCQICHGELARLRPGRKQLTLFYLAVAAGGALGAAVVSLLAPALLEDYWEFHAGIALVWVLVTAVWWHDRTSPWYRGDMRQFAVLVAAGGFVVFDIILSRFERWDEQSRWYAAAIAANLTLIIVRMTWRRPIAAWGSWPRAFLATMILVSLAGLGLAVKESHDGQIIVGRNFYGVLRLRLFDLDAETPALQLNHGSINHGIQLRRPGAEMQPTTYYGPSSGAGRALAAVREEAAGSPLHIGVLGLGTGTLATYAQTDDRVRFYEINPMVTMLSIGEPAIFSFLRGSAGDVDVVPGDARLVLEAELALGERQEFDVLIVDVFSSDSIPVHLVTLEAGRLYLEHLRESHGILAIHTSNRFLDLPPVLSALADELGLYGLVVSDEGADDLAMFPSTWVLLSRNQAILDNIALEAADAWPLDEDGVLFTDRYSNLFRILD